MSIKISRILHAGYIFEYEETQIAFDPIFENPFSRNCYAFPDVKFDLEQIKQLKLSAVFISHYHDDHCSFESLNLLNRETPIYMFCIFDEMFLLLKELGFKNIISLKLDVPIKVGSFEITPRRALDEDVDSIFHIKTAGLNILNVVDSWIDPSTLKILSKSAPWDLVLWPFQTMREIEVLSPNRAEPASRELPHEWIEQLQVLKPRYVVPSSCQFKLEDWSWYNQAFFPITYRQFEKQIAEILPKSEVVRLNPSASMFLDKNSMQRSSPLSWIQPIGEQNVDYEYKSDIQAPPTYEIAKHFPALTNEQTERVLSYCQMEVIEKYKALGPPSDNYFLKPRTWKLSIFDQLGKSREFFYRLHEDNIEIIQPSEFSWLTEVPIFKLYAALETGESLTSMYVRVNDTVFEPEIENEIKFADTMSDPLIRCLFDGAFASYQKAQLTTL